MRNSSSVAVTPKQPWYPIELPVRYASPADASVKGSGRTLAINSRAVQFASDQDLQEGLNVELVISWPARLSDGAGLTLSVTGTIRRSTLRKVEVSICRHEFRTRRRAWSKELTDTETVSQAGAGATAPRMV